MLYEQFRPKTFDELVGNQGLKDFFNLTKDIPHTVFLSGGFGLGKTSVARLIAKKINDAELHEIDMGVEGTVDRVREMIVSTEMSSLFNENKVFILDEIHKLTSQGQTALLKSLEEPNDGVYWILCTSEPDKVLNSIRSRSVEFHLEAAGIDGLRVLIKNFLDEYPLTMENLKDFAKILPLVRGDYRKFYTILEKFVPYYRNNILVTTEMFDKTISVFSESIEKEQKFLEVVKSRNLRSILEFFDKNESSQPSSLLYGLAAYLKKAAHNKDDIKLYEKVLEFICQYPQVTKHTLELFAVKVSND